MSFSLSVTLSQVFKKWIGWAAFHLRFFGSDDGVGIALDSFPLKVVTFQSKSKIS